MTVDIDGQGLPFPPLHPSPLKRHLTESANEMVRRLIPPLQEVDRSGSF
jgi:hypothetical protein